MTPIKTLLLPALLLMGCIPAQAATVLQCEDANGNKTFETYCPPGTKEVGQKNYTVTESEAAPNLEALTLYMTPNCDSCKQVKEFIEYRKLPITEKNVDNNAELQQELKEKSGELRVPVLLVGDKALAGFNREALLQALTAAGYISAEPAPEAEAEAAETE